MVLKNAVIAVIAATLFAWSGLVIADEYRPDELLNLNASEALLSPKPLGPPSQFVPGPLDARVDRGSEDAQARADEHAQAQVHAQPPAEPKAESKIVRTREAEPKVTGIRKREAEPRIASRKTREAGPKFASRRTRVAEPKTVTAKTRVAHVRAEKPRAPVRTTKQARRHSNPLDAQASDTRIQVWPCKSGAICKWKR